MATVSATATIPSASTVSARAAMPALPCSGSSATAPTPTTARTRGRVTTRQLELRCRRPSNGRLSRPARTRARTSSAWRSSARPPTVYGPGGASLRPGAAHVVGDDPERLGQAPPGPSSRCPCPVPPRPCTSTTGSPVPTSSYQGPHAVHDDLCHRSLLVAENGPDEIRPLQPNRAGTRSGRVGGSRAGRGTSP